MTTALPDLTPSTGATDFIDDARIEALIAATPEDPVRVREIIAKAMAKIPLLPEETAALIAARSPDLHGEILAAARQLKKDVYGNRIVLFAPLYIGNRCVNDCSYCGFRSSNQDAIRRELDSATIQKQVQALTGRGHKRLILVFGEHPDYGPEFIRDSVKTVYAAGDIRRVNVNAAPLDVEGYKIVAEAGIGTYQIFHETYHHDAYAKAHPRKTRKGDYLWRLDGPSRAMQAGIDDVGIGALFGLADWRFETISLVTHARHLFERHGVGPHTISFPRLRPAQGVVADPRFTVSDEDFIRLVAILRLSVPYTGMICTAREPAWIRDALIGLGVSQVDAGTNIDLGGYSEQGDATVVEQRTVHHHTDLKKAQFELADTRSVEEMVERLVDGGQIPSFCTACYRAGRTGEVFMEYAVPGFIEKLCTPNALTTFQEYLCDHASPALKAKGETLIRSQVAGIADEKIRHMVAERLQRIAKGGERDLYV